MGGGGAGPGRATESGPAKVKELKAMHTYRNQSGGSIVPAEITGLELALQRRSKKERAQLAVAIEAGRTRLVGLTDTQLARVCGVSAQYIHQMRLALIAARARRSQHAHNVVQLAAE
jgi:hypothetical protein